MGLKASRPGLAGHDDPAAAALPTRAAAGDQGAWDEIVERYAPMVWSICTRFRLSDRELEDAAQNVWLQLVEQLGKPPEPAALAGWLAAATRRECRRVVTAARGPEPPGTHPDAGPADAGPAADDAGPADAGPAADDAVIGEEIIIAERHAALRAALAELPAPCQPLIGMLVSDPPHSDTAISTALGIPAESIGPRLARCLEWIRESSALLGLAEAGVNRPGGDPGA
jgi:RNA polymerase sigma factor (sigma-70 family)